MTIHKIQINAITYQQKRVMPVDAKILSIKKQYGEPVVYYSTKNPAIKTEKSFFAVTTGSEAPANAEYIDTMLFDDDSYVIHFFMEKTQ